MLNSPSAYVGRSSSESGVDVNALADDFAYRVPMSKATDISYILGAMAEFAAERGLIARWAGGVLAVLMCRRELPPQVLHAWNESGYHLLRSLRIAAALRSKF